MNTMIRKEAARLWYALKIAAGTGPDAGERPEAAKPARSEAEREGERDPALVVISRAGRSNVQAQQRSQSADGVRPAYALPYNAHPVEPRVAETLAGGDAGIAV